MHRRKWYRVTWIWGQKILRKKIGNKDSGSPDFVELSLSVGLMKMEWSM